MYSRRRYRRTYRNKTNGIYSPSNKNYNLPSYKQKVGRTLQASPRTLTNNTTTMISRPILDEYYKLLVRYKYPMPVPPAPGPIFPEGMTNFLYNFSGNVSYVDLPERIDAEYLYNNYVSNVLENLPAAPEGYQYVFQLNSISMSRSYTGTTDTSRYSFTWNTPILASPYNLCSKTLDSTPQINFQGEMIAIPSGPEHVRVTRINFAQGVIHYTFNNETTTDAIVTDDVIYPLITSDATSETYGSRVEISKTGSPPSGTDQMFTLYMSILVIEQ